MKENYEYTNTILNSRNREIKHQQERIERLESRINHELCKRQEIETKLSAERTTKTSIFFLLCVFSASFILMCACYLKVDSENRELKKKIFYSQTKNIKR
jgi:hypothetical protein